MGGGEGVDGVEEGIFCSKMVDFEKDYWVVSLRKHKIKQWGSYVGCI
jgi:hypothetical protein